MQYKLPANGALRLRRLYPTEVNFISRNYTFSGQNLSASSIYRMSQRAIFRLLLSEAALT